MNEKKSFPKASKGDKFAELRSDQYVANWLSNISQSTHNQKLAVFQCFLDFVQKDPQTLILEQSNDLRELDPLKRSNIAKIQLNTYFKYLIGEKVEINGQKLLNDKPISNNSARIKVYSMILGFYARNSVNIKFGRNEIPKEEENGVTDKVWRNGDGNDRISNEDKKDWLKKIYNQFSNSKNKSIFLCLKSSGLDCVDLFNLKHSDFTQGYFKSLNVCYIQGKRSKTGEYFQTFFDSEAVDELKSYFIDRERKGEKLDKDSWLFVVDKVDKNGNYNQMSYPLFASDLKNVCDLLDLKNITCKRIRSWFDSNVKRDLDAEKYGLTERMMGHKTDISVKYNDITKDSEQFAQWYKDEIEPKLLILGRSEYIKKVNQDMEKINSTIADQAKELTTLKEENKELKDTIGDLSKKFEELQKLMLKVIKD